MKTIEELRKEHHDQMQTKIILFLSRVHGISFSLNWEHLDCKNIIFLVEQLNQRSNITTLNLCKGNLGSASAIELAKLQYVTDLDVSHNEISQDGAIALLNNPNFRKLDLSNSYFTYANSELLNAVLANNMLEKFTVVRSGLPAEIETRIADHFERKKLSLEEKKSFLLSSGVRFLGADLTNTALQKKVVEIITAVPPNGLVK